MFYRAIFFVVFLSCVFYQVETAENGHNRTSAPAGSAMAALGDVLSLPRG